MKLRRNQASNQRPEIRQRPARSGGRPQAFSYYARRNDIQPVHGSNRITHRPDPTKKKPTIWQYLGQRFGALIAGLAVLALLIMSVQVSVKPRVVILNGGNSYKLHPTNVYQQAFETSMRKSWTNTNKLTIDTKGLARDLKAQYPELAEVSVTLPVLGQRPILYLAMTEPRLILAPTAGAAYVLDDNGRAIVPTAQVDTVDSLRLPTVTDQSGLKPRQGEIVLNSSSVDFIRTVVYELQAAHVGYTQLVLPAASQELDVYVAGKPYFVKFNLHQTNARQQVGAFLAVQASLAQKGTAPSSYIDVRVSGRAYYQ